jgi:CO/xanthine dehydrogenase FAD-binding subunit
MMNLRMSFAAQVIDISGIAALRESRAAGERHFIGAGVTHAMIEDGKVEDPTRGYLRHVAAGIAYRSVRNRGTLGGSLAHADPAAELPAVVAALDGRLVVRGPAGERVLTTEQFFVSYLTTALETGELLVEVRIPVAAPRTGAAFVEVSRRHGDFALVGVAASVTLDETGVCVGCALALTGVGPTPIVARAAASTIVGARPTPVMLEEAGRRAAAALRPDSDLHASSEYRQHVAGVLARRALGHAVERAQDDR